MTNAELVLLSLIAENPRHGYDLEHVIAERGMRNWTEIAFSSIYFVLNQLVKQELAVRMSNPPPGAGRRVRYSRSPRPGARHCKKASNRPYPRRSLAAGILCWVSLACRC